MLKYIFSTISLIATCITLSAQTADLSGTFKTEGGNGIPGVVVELFDDQGQVVGSTVTDGAGAYQFLAIPSDQVYTIEAEKEDVAVNGLSTFDIVLAAQHILGIQNLNSPYQVMAGDVNLSGDLTTLDMVLMRSVVLAMNEEFPGGKEWIFVSSEQTFSNPNSPFPVIPDNSINLTQTITDADFIGVKLGTIRD